MRGGGGLKVVRPGLPNPLLSRQDEIAMRNRQILLANVSTMLANVAPPSYWPLFFVDCMDCGRLHFLDDPSCVWKAAPNTALEQ